MTKTTSTKRKGKSMSNEIIKAYKAFNKDMTCRGFRYEEGKEYETDKAKICKSGFHACLMPLEILKYYKVTESVFHEVELSGDVVRDSDSSKVATTKIKIGRKLSFDDLRKAQIELSTNAGGDYSTNAGGYRSTNAGGVGSTNAGRGNCSGAADSICVARGNGCKVKGGIGSILVLCEENADNYSIRFWKAAYVDGEIIKADTWYKLDDNGNLAEVAAACMDDDDDEEDEDDADMD